jgi:transposase
VQSLNSEVIGLAEMRDKQGRSADGGLMARYGRLLTDAQWEKVQPLLPRPRSRQRGGRPRASDRKVLEGILWILRSGARWQDLPEEFPSLAKASPQTTPMQGTEQVPRIHALQANDPTD